MPGLSSVTSNAQVQADSHGCPACPHPAIGPATIGSPDVFVNGKPALRVGTEPITGVHAACCGPNTWKASQGSTTVSINGGKAVRVGDQTQHCGGVGHMVQGSPNVNAGG